MDYKRLVVVPARYNSTRFPGKLLAPLAGKPVLQWVLEALKDSRKADYIIVATDDERIYEFVRKIGFRSAMTSPNHESGTDRVAEVAEYFQALFIVNVQGDEPFVRADVVDRIFDELERDSSADIVTPITPASTEEVEDPNVVKVVIDKNGYALYFSRSPIPYNRSGDARYFKHIGIYGYRITALFSFINLPPSTLERAEGLEQLRALENGMKIKTIMIEDYEGVSIDTPEDLRRAEEYVRRKGHL